MKLHFNCPICATDLHLTIHESTGPCPSCQNTLEIRIQIKAHEPAINAQRTADPRRSQPKVRNWKCSGIPHGTASLKKRA